MFRDPNIENRELNSTTQLFIDLSIDINLNNNYISNIADRDIFGNIVDQVPDLSKRLKQQYFKLREKRLIDPNNKAIPTCAEITEDGEVVVLWRESIKILGAGNMYPFVGGNKAVLMKGEQAKPIRIEEYMREELLARHDSIVPNTNNQEVLGGKVINDIMLFESSPETYPLPLK